MSRYENHFTAQRKDADESNAMEEMNIAENGPHHQHENLIEAAMNQYWNEHGQTHVCHMYIGITERGNSLHMNGSTSC